MSSKPSAEGIQSLRLTLDRMAEIDAETRRIRLIVDEHNKRLDALGNEHADLAERVPKMLESMDLRSAGNFGWEARIVWALRELASQYKAVSREGSSE